MLPVRPPASRESVRPTSPAPSARMTFTADLAPSLPQGADSVPPAAGAPSGSVRLTFGDDASLTYTLTVQNAIGVTYTGAWIFASAGGAKRLAILATDVVLTGPYVQLRGTGVVPGQSSGQDLLESIRARPADFEVRLQPAAPGTVVLRGPLK